MKGRFNPINISRSSVALPVKDNLDEVIHIVKAQEKSLVCINDSDISDFLTAKNRIIDAFECILPEKSEFEL